MTQDLPGVRLTQVDVSSNATLRDAELFATFVAPLYRVVKEHLILANGLFRVGGVTSENPVNANYPVMDPGAVVDLTSVLITIKNGIIQVLKPTTGAAGFVAGVKTFTDANVDFITSGVKAGDTVWVTSFNGLKGQYIVDTVTQHTLTFTYDIYMTFSGSDTGYVITRPISSWLLTSSAYTPNTTGVSITAIAMGSLIFLSGEIDISYRALRKDKAGIVKYTNFDDVLADMETSDIGNKIGYYIQQGIIPANGDSTAFLVYFLSDDTQEAYLEALTDLRSHPETYMLVPLSLDPVVINAYASHVNVVSQPEESLFRVLFTTTPLTTQNVLASGSSLIALG